MPDLDAHISDLVGRLSLEDKVLVLTGRDFWSTWPLPDIGLRPMVVSDGPSGVRGERWDERDPSLNLPSATALSSSWDLDIARRYGAVAAVEARRKNVDVVLGPTINIHRSPLGGRHFEAFSEDPFLTGELAAAYVDGLQDNGVGATPKHYVANDAETDRFTVDNRVSERALREVYLAAFEKAVSQSRAWLVMSAYNQINGAPATENELLETPLNSEWGFDGVVISDWTAVTSINSARFSQDLVFPGPDGAWGTALVDAVRDGTIAESAVDRKVARILKLAARVGALEGFDTTPPVHVEDGVAFAREAAAAGTVLVRNEGVLPLDPGALTSIAVIGDNAVRARTQGGGSATVYPAHVVSPLEGLRTAFPDAEVTYARGAIVQEGVAGFALEDMTNPVTGEPGARVTWRAADGAELQVEDRRATEFVWLGPDAPLLTAATVEIELDYTPAESGRHMLGFGGVTRGEVWVADAVVLDVTPEPADEEHPDLMAAPQAICTAVDFVAGQTVRLRLRYTNGIKATDQFIGMVLAFGFAPDDVDYEDLIAEAVEVAHRADVAVVVVGTNSRVESEGFDRADLALPGWQDDLVWAVARSSPRTVVVVNSGSPVEMPWRNEVSAVVLSWFGGQEYGNAVADVLTGAVEPGGRLPTTWPSSLADAPVSAVIPTKGVLEYTEGIHVGYKAWLKADRAPAYPFGFGLGYTTWDVTLDAVPETVSTADASVPVTVVVTNTGHRPGKCVPQVYLARATSSVDRPVRWLAGFATVTCAPGESTAVVIDVPLRSFAYWGDGAWRYEEGSFEVALGTSVVDVVGQSAVTLTA